ncbi:hypothetical protein, partial [Xylanibacter rodentium]|uniref:hypothetical protein n=1 Tax=Xylanibacter rodentium TaxID=2736289 RepID=UPI0025958B0E
HDAIEGLQTEQVAHERLIGQHHDAIEGLQTEQVAHERLIHLLQSAADAAQTTADAAKAVTDSKGQPDGIAPLGVDGKVPAAHLPGYVDDVVEFGAVVSGVTVELGVVSGCVSTDAWCMVVYDDEHHVFLLAESRWRPAADDGMEATAEGLSAAADAIMDDDYQSDLGSWIPANKFRYYSNWQDGDVFGRLSLAGRVPEAGKVYVSTREKRVYHWSGTRLELVGSGLVLGATPGTAFPGDEGASTTEKVDALRDEFDGHVSSSERRVEELQDIVDSHAMHVMIVPDLSYRLGKIPLVSLNGIVDAVEELDGLESVHGTTNYYFVRQEKAIYWIDYGVASGPVQSISTIGMAPIMITDALFICGNQVYSFDGERLNRVVTTADVDAMPAARESSMEVEDVYRPEMKVFDDEWRAAGGTVIVSGVTYGCNGTDDLTYEEAVEIKQLYSKRETDDYSRMFFAATVRALLPVWLPNASVKLSSMFQSAAGLTKIVFRSNVSPCIVRIGDFTTTFHTCSNLKEIDGVLDVSNMTSPIYYPTFMLDGRLEDVWISGLKYSANFQDCKSLSLASLQYLVDNAANTTAITITVHHDVYAKLTDESNTEWNALLAQAAEKNITFATV